MQHLTTRADTSLHPFPLKSSMATYLPTNLSYPMMSPPHLPPPPPTMLNFMRRFLNQVVQDDFSRNFFLQKMQQEEEQHHHRRRRCRRHIVVVTLHSRTCELAISIVIASNQNNKKYCPIFNFENKTHFKASLRPESSQWGLVAWCLRTGSALYLLYYR